jgi:FLVCR family MFS transporter 7
VSTTSAQFFDVTEGTINWLSTAFLFAFVAASPVVIWTLNRGGPKAAIVIASVLILVGNWVRYIGTRVDGGNFGVVMFGQILVGLAQPFVLAAPTRFSDLWFSSRGRVTATAIPSLANPLGGALGQLICPFLATSPAQIPSMTLYIAIIASVASIPSFFIPSRPPLPPCPSAAETKMPTGQAIKTLIRRSEFWLITIPFIIYVGFFNAFSSLINQILEPYGFSESDAGICGAVLIVVGLVTAAILSPIVDKYKCFLLSIKLQVPVIAICYLCYIWIPGVTTLVVPCLIAGILGGASFGLVPIVLEYIVELTHPISPELTSTIAWTGGQLLGGIFIIIMNALKAPSNPPPGTRPGDMRNALIFEAVIAMVAMPLPLLLGIGGSVQTKRINADREAQVGGDSRRSSISAA